MELRVDQRRFILMSGKPCFADCNISRNSVFLTNRFLTVKTNKEVSLP